MTKHKLLLTLLMTLGISSAACYKEYALQDGKEMITGADLAGGNNNNTNANVSSPIDYYEGSEELAKYVNQFFDNAKMEGVDPVPQTQNPRLEIRIASLSSYGSSTIGLCSRSATKRVVTLHTTWWNNASEASREILMHHELGHCVLKRGHTSERLDSGSYASIMTPYILGGSTYLDNQSHYIQELFANHQMARATIAAASVAGNNSVNDPNGRRGAPIEDICNEEELFPEGASAN